jgi:hypothetical protein
MTLMKKSLFSALNGPLKKAPFYKPAAKAMRPASALSP